MTTLSLSIRLMRAKVMVEDALREDSGLNEHPAERARMFVSQAPPTQPRWYQFVNAFAREPLERMNTMSCGAVLFLSGVAPLESLDNQKAREEVPFTCAVTFGTAHHGLNPDAFEDSFGLRVVLNAVRRSNLRGLDTATLDSTTVQRRIQTSRNADLQIFGMDFDRDLLRLATGTPSDSSFARSLSGKDALSMHKRLEPAELLDCCTRAVTLFHKRDYQHDFSFIDHIVPVRQRELSEFLDSFAFAQIGKLVCGQPSDLHLALPDVLNPEDTTEIGYYGTGLRSGTKRTFSEVSIDDYVAELQNGNFGAIDSMAVLRASHEIRTVTNGEGDRSHKRRVYDCFVFEVEHDGHVFVLFNGSWFQVDRVFHEQVEADFQRLVVKPFIAETSARNERELIAGLEADSNLLNMDQVKLSPAGTSGANLEPCDFLSRDRQFIHLKDGHGSAPISHLWNQGLVSIEAFVRDSDYRGRLRTEIQKRQHKHKRNGFDELLPRRRQRPTPNEYTVVFGIMRKPYPRSGLLGLPFFSKVSLRSVAARIDSMGFRVEVHLIHKIDKGAAES